MVGSWSYLVSVAGTVQASITLLSVITLQEVQFLDFVHQEVILISSLIFYHKARFGIDLTALTSF